MGQFVGILMVLAGVSLIVFSQEVAKRKIKDSHFLPDSFRKFFYPFTEEGNRRFSIVVGVILIVVGLLQVFAVLP